MRIEFQTVELKCYFKMSLEIWKFKCCVKIICYEQSLQSGPKQFLHTATSYVSLIFVFLFFWFYYCFNMDIWYPNIMRVLFYGHAHIQEHISCVSNNILCTNTNTHAVRHTSIHSTWKRSPLIAVERHWEPLEPSGYKAASSTPKGLGPTKPGPVFTHTTADTRSTSSRACSILKLLTGKRKWERNQRELGVDETT